MGYKKIMEASHLKRGIKRNESPESGFTLIEMIAALALLALLASIFGMGLVAAVESYDFSRSNVQVAQKGQMAMTRMIRELTELTQVVRIDNGANPYILYERIADAGTSRWGLFFDSTGHQLMLAENPPETATEPQGDILVDGVQAWSVRCFQGANELSLPISGNALLSTMQITLSLVRPDDAVHTQNFTTLIHLRNNNNEGGAVR